MLLESQRVFQNHLMTGPLGNSEFYFPRISCSENKIHQVLNVGANLPLATYSLHNRLVSFNTNNGDKHFKNTHFMHELDFSYASQHTFPEV